MPDALLAKLPILRQRADPVAGDRFRVPIPHAIGIRPRRFLGFGSIDTDARSEWGLVAAAALMVLDFSIPFTWK